jgi:hypothetical protein
MARFDMWPALLGGPVRSIIKTNMSHCSCSSTAYRRGAPIGGCLYHKLFDLFFVFANIFLNVI